MSRVEDTSGRPVPVEGETQVWLVQRPCRAHLESEGCVVTWRYQQETNSYVFHDANMPIRKKEA